MKKESFWRLFAAYGADAVLSGVIGSVPVIWAMARTSEGPWLVYGVLAMFALQVLYFACLDGIWGHTPGKWLFKVQVSGKDGTSPFFGRALTAYWVDFLLLKPCLLAVGVYFFMKGIFLHYPNGNDFIFMLGFIIPVGLESLYFAAIEARWAHSLGKAIVGLCVHSEK